MASAGAFPRSNHIYVQHRVSTSSNSSHRALTASSSVIIPFYAEWKSAHLQIINYQKRQEQHHRRMLLPLNSRPCFCMWAGHPALLFFFFFRDLKPRIGFLEDWLEDEDSLKKLLRRFPGILAYTVEHMENHVAYLKSAVFTEDNIAIIVKVYPQILSLSIERTLQPRIEYLENCSLSKKEIAKLLIRYPTFLGLSFDENLSKKSTFLQKIGFQPYTYELAQALTTVTRINYEKLQATIGLLLSYGLSYVDICLMGSKQPHILRFSSKCLKPKIDYLVNDMYGSSKNLVSFPAFLGYSLEDRIKPRHKIMKQLISRGLVKQEYSLNRLLTISDKVFMEMAIEKGYRTDFNQ